MSKEQLKGEIIEAVKSLLEQHKLEVIELLESKEREVLSLLEQKGAEIVQKVNDLVDTCQDLEVEPPQVMNMTITIPARKKNSRVA